LRIFSKIQLIFKKKSKNSEAQEVSSSASILLDMDKMNLFILRSFFAWQLLFGVSCFVPMTHHHHHLSKHVANRASSRPPNQPLRLFPEDYNSFLTSVEFFDGSEVVDPVVVSNVFWAGLKAKLLSFLIGQLLATAAFIFITSLAAQQIGKVADAVADKLFGGGQREFKPLPDSRAATRTAQPDFFKLLICVAVDCIGASSELLPVVGEATDVVWAPIAALILRNLFGGSNVILVMEFVEVSSS
jgi:hypothetical protein